MFGKFLLWTLFFLFFHGVSILSQVENVPVTNPVYHFLKHLQVRGLVDGRSFFKLPFSLSEVRSMLQEVQTKHSELDDYEKKLLNRYLVEFEVFDRNNAVLIPSARDTVQILSLRLFSSDEKFIYHYADEKNTVNVKPLGSLRSVAKFGEGVNKLSANYGNLGFRVYGTLESHLGYYIQATNGKFFSGDKTFGAQEDKTLANSVKFTLLNSDFDLVESHVRYQNEWFYAGIARESRFLGSGVMQKLVVSDNAPPMDEFFLGVLFKKFKYNFSHFSLIAQPKTPTQAGASAVIPPKYMVLHSATFQFSKLNLTYFETIIYSERNFELAYLNPFTFLKSVEHSLHDRDKASMGFALEWNPLRNFQVLGTWMMEDMIFSEIGKNFWGNKTAWNIGAIYSLPISTDIAFEYTRVEPYMFTHFNNLNNRTNDGRLIGTYLYPNSDEISFTFKNFSLGRYPFILRLAYVRHGANETDSTGNVVRNVGGDFNVNHSPTDNYRVVFLDGVLKDSFLASLYFGIEIIRNFNLQLMFDYRKEQNHKGYFVAKIIFRFEDF